MGKSESKERKIVSVLEQSAVLIRENRQRRKKVYGDMVQRVYHRNRNGKFGFLYKCFFGLGESTLVTILAFMADGVRELLGVSASFHCRVIELFDGIFAKVESDFASKYSSLLLFRKSFLSSSNLTASNKSGYRIDRAIIAEVKPELANYTINISYSFQAYSTYQNLEFNFKFDCVSKSNKKTWISIDETNTNFIYSRYSTNYHKKFDFLRDFNYSKGITAQIPQVCCNDYIEFALNWFNLKFLTRIDSIKFNRPVIELTRDIIEKIERIRFTEEKFLLEIMRKSDAEVMHQCWYLPEYFYKKCKVTSFKDFEPFLTCTKVKIASHDFKTFRYFLKATKSGVITNSFSRLGILIEVIKKQSKTTTEIKRSGLSFDRFKPLQIRKGDFIQIFIKKFP